MRVGCIDVGKEMGRGGKKVIVNFITGTSAILCEFNLERRN